MLRIALLFCVATAGVFGQGRFQPLFNGKDLKGWKQCNGTALYKVENGEIVGTTVEGSPNSFLCTEKQYGDFVLEYETKTDPVLNSGVQIRAHRYAADSMVMTNNGKQIVERKHPAGRVYGYQVETANEKSGASGGIYDEARRGWLHNIAGDPVASKAFKDGAWNKYRVEAHGDRLRVWVNGVACADVVDSMDLTGFIGLQVHAFKGEKPAEVRWRNVRIQDNGRHAWKPLFDGVSMKGWTKQGPGNWTIENGAFHAVSVPNEEKGGFMVHERSFGDATLRVRFKLEPTGNANSGFFVRADPVTHAGYEVEIDEQKGTGGLFEVGGRRWVDGPSDNAAMKKGDWNELVASTHGNRIVFHLNGMKTLDLPNDAQGRKQGNVILQLHNRRVTNIWFKDVAVLEAVK